MTFPKSPTPFAQMFDRRRLVRQPALVTAKAPPCMDRLNRILLVAKVLDR